MQDFGNIKTMFNNILIDGIVKKDDKGRKLFKKYFKTIKESEILTTQFLVYNNIETKVDKDFNSAALYVSENMKLLRKYKISDIVRENKRLVSLLDKTEITKSEPNKLYESLSYLIFTPSKPSNVDKISGEIKNVIEYINKNEPIQIQESINLPNSLITTLMVQKYNERYDHLDAQDKEVLRALINSNSAYRIDFYNKTVNECLTLVNGLLEETNEDSKDKLLKVKEKLLEEKSIKEDQFLEKITKLIDLKNNLIN